MRKRFGCKFLTKIDLGRIEINKKVGDGKPIPYFFILRLLKK